MGSWPHPWWRQLSVKQGHRQCSGAQTTTVSQGRETWKTGCQRSTSTSGMELAGEAQNKAVVYMLLLLTGNRGWKSCRVSGVVWLFIPGGLATSVLHRSCQHLNYSTEVVGVGAGKIWVQAAAENSAESGGAAKYIQGPSPSPWCILNTSRLIWLAECQPDRITGEAEAHWW